MNIYDFILGKILKDSGISADFLIKWYNDSEKILRLSNDKLVQYFYKAKIKEEDIKKFLETKNKFNRDEKTFISKCNSEIEQLREKFGIKIISFSDPEYPNQLKKIQGIPLILYVKGNISFDYSKSIAIVGTRNVSAYAKEKVAEISKDLAKDDFCIISGLARGVDGQAQSSTVAIQKKTIAVLPFLSDKIYPPDHTQLAKDILLNGGALISENFFTEKKYDRSLFTDRNRMISGLSRAILIVEGSRISGSLSQYNHAKRQGKVIFTLKPIKEHEGTYLPKKIVNEGGKEIKSASEIIKILNTGFL